MEDRDMRHSLGKTVARLRKERGWTQLELARRLSVSDKTVSKWEMENGYPEITLIPVIAELLGISTDYLLTGNEREGVHGEASGEEIATSAAATGSALHRQPCRVGIRHLLLSAVAGALIASLLTLTFTLFVPLARHKRAAGAFADGRLAEAREMYHSTGVLLDGYGYAEVVDAFIRAYDLPLADTLASLCERGISVIVSYHTDGGILVEAGESETGGDRQNPTGIRKILYTGVGIGTLPSTVRTGFGFGGWSLGGYSYNIEEKGAPVYLTAVARWTNEGGNNA